MWQEFISFRPRAKKAENTKECKDFESFFKVVQEKIGFFNSQKAGKSEPYQLFEQQKQWLTLFDPDKPQRRALLASRDKGKSEVVTILGSAWNLYQNHTLKIGIMSFKFENAEKLVHQILKILDALDLPLKHRSGGYYTLQANAHTPNLMPLGLMSTVRGMHFDYLVMDDPLTINEQFSKKYINRSRYFLNEGASLAKYIILNRPTFDA